MHQPVHIQQPRQPSLTLSKKTLKTTARELLYYATAELAIFGGLENQFLVVPAIWNFTIL